MIVTKKNTSDKSFFAGLGNEFLFSREFEYESPLTPHEMANALKAIEKLEHSSFILSAAKLKHSLSTVAHSDKAVDFTILLEEDKNSAWSSRMNLLYSEGSITADPETGMSIIQGRTRFSGQYYMIWAAVFALNLMPFFTGAPSAMSFVWLGIAVLFWFAMYNERNTLADSLDTLIMHAKSESSLAILEGETGDSSTAETLVEAKRLMENE